MIQSLKDYRFMAGFIIAHLLLYFTFDHKGAFWYMFTATYLLLISFAIISEELEDRVSALSYFLYGILSGLLLFGMFFIGNSIIELFSLPFSDSISALYSRFSPASLWHYIVLLIVVIPGEEIFWRGFIQKRLLKYTSVWNSIVVSSLLYASVHLHSGQPVLAFAALFAGLFWSALYAWKRSIPLVIVSHLVFDLFLFVILPFS